MTLYHFCTCLFTNKESLWHLKKNPFYLSGEIKFLKCHVLTLVGCLQIFPAAHLSQYRRGGETSEKRGLLGLGPTESSGGSPALVFRKTPVLQLWGLGGALTQHTVLPPLFISELLQSSHVLRQLSGLSDNVWIAVRFLLSSPLPQTQFSCSFLSRGVFLASFFFPPSTSVALFIPLYLPSLFQTFDTQIIFFPPASGRPLCENSF